MPRLDDGHSTIVTFALNGSVKLWEKEVTPPGLSGGGANDTTTMRNLVWRTKKPKKLRTLTDPSYTAAYDPTVWDQILAMHLQNQLITVTYSDGSTLVFWGWIEELKPNRVVEGEQPTLEITIMCSNEDNSGNEVAPVLTAA